MSIFENNNLRNAIIASGYMIAHQPNPTPARPARTRNIEELSLCESSKNFLSQRNITTLYSHQCDAIEAAQEGKNVCVSTSTSSGKTEIFQLAAIELLNRNPEAKVLAVYSAKALNLQQKGRWENVSRVLYGDTEHIGIIDGDQRGNEVRRRAMEKPIVVMTPDTIHAFLLARIDDSRMGPEVKDFIGKLELIIIDEIHLYRGYFGTNAAFLFRRLNNVRRLIRKDNSFAQYITASATLPNPAQHSSDIAGVRDFVNIGKDKDGSPSAETQYYYIEIGPNDDGIPRNATTMVTKLIKEIVNYDDAKLIAFMEGRQKAGEIAYTYDDLQNRYEKNVEESLGQDENQQLYLFRAGLATEDRQRIMDEMENGNFKGVVCTSALEIGIDISGLNIAIIANMPFDMNSYQQRVGRVGRGSARKSAVIVINDDSVRAKMLFGSRNFRVEEVLRDLEPALYLTNKNVQNAHACCHVEYEVDGLNDPKKNGSKFVDDYFSGCEGFTELCNEVAQHQTTEEYENMASLYADQPHSNFSLRSTECNYTIENVNNDLRESVTRTQLYTEAYPMAIRNYATMENNEQQRRYMRIGCHINRTDRVIRASDYHGYLRTKPNVWANIYPNFKKEVIGHIECGEALILNMSMEEVTTIHGYWQINNRDREYFSYRNINNIGRSYVDKCKIDGIVLYHPELNRSGIERKKLARMIVESFLMQKAFEMRDINYLPGFSTNRNDTYGIQAGDRFIAIYDKNEGFNITQNLMEETTLRNTFSFLNEHLMDLSQDLFDGRVGDTTLQVAGELAATFVESDIVQIGIVPNQQNNIIKAFKNRSKALYINMEKYNLDKAEDDDIDDIPDEYLEPCICYTDITATHGLRYEVEIDGTGETYENVRIEQLRETEDSTMRDFDTSRNNFV